MKRTRDYVSNRSRSPRASIFRGATEKDTSGERIGTPSFSSGPREPNTVPVPQYTNTRTEHPQHAVTTSPAPTSPERSLQDCLEEIVLQLDQIRMRSEGPSCALRPALPSGAAPVRSRNEQRAFGLVGFASPPFSVKSRPAAWLSTWERLAEWLSYWERPLLVAFLTLFAAGAIAAGFLLRGSVQAEFNTAPMPEVVAARAPASTSTVEERAAATALAAVAKRDGKLTAETVATDQTSEPRADNEQLRINARQGILLDEAKRLAESSDFTTDETLRRMQEIFAEINRLDAQRPGPTSVADAPEAIPTVTEIEADRPTTAATPGAAGEPAVAATIHLRVGRGVLPSERQRIQAALARAGYSTILVHEMPFRISQSRVGYFRDEDLALAEALIAELRGTVDDIELRDYRTLIPAPKPGRLDLWIES